MQNKNIQIILVLCAAVLIAGCASGPREIDTSESAELSFDGLYPVTNTPRNSRVWAREDFSLAGYTKIMLQGVGIEYRPVKRTSSSMAMRSSATDAFPISDKSKAQVNEIFKVAFTSELANVKGLELVTEPGPDVLLVRGYLLDVISRVPPDPVGTRSAVFLSSVGEATLAIELIDSESDTTLLRAVQRRAAETLSGAMWSSPVTNMAEVKRLADSWALRVREKLEALAETYSIGKPG
jgi:hypothetical protein